MQPVSTGLANGLDCTATGYTVGLGAAWAATVSGGGSAPQGPAAPSVRGDRTASAALGGYRS